MKERGKRLISGICILANATFTALSIIDPLFSLPASVISLHPLFFDLPFSRALHYNEYLLEKFSKAVKNAISKTTYYIEKMEEDVGFELSEHQRNLLYDLLEPNLEIEDINSLINTTEKYREKYSKVPYANEVINIFNNLFIEEISDDQDLCRVCLLNSGKSTLEELKKIHSIAQDTIEKVSAINNEMSDVSQGVSDINQNLSKFSNGLDNINSIIRIMINSIVFSSVSMSVFILLFVFTRKSFGENAALHENVLFWIVPLSYYITDIILNVCGFKFKFLNRFYSSNKKIINYISRVLIHTLSSVTIFSVFSQFFGIIDLPIFGILVLFFIAGDLIGQMLVNIMFKVNR